MTITLPPLPELGPEWTEHWTKVVHAKMQAYATAAIQDHMAKRSTPICNLWVDPETQAYEVDSCTHPLSELIPVWTIPPDTHAVLQRCVEAMQMAQKADRLAFQLLANEHALIDAAIADARSLLDGGKL